MPDSAVPFISARKNQITVTKKRINSIIKYLIYCYQLQLTDKAIYSKSGRLSKQKFEDYLKTKFVDDYLRKNKNYFKSINSNIEEIFFGKEETELYTSITDIEQEDKIDICVKGLGLQQAWSGSKNGEIYFAIECKRIENLSDTKNYIADIQKFVDRQHTEFRLPFEGMIAFIENGSLKHFHVSNKVTELLKATPTITTIQYLIPIELYNTFEGSYTSSHNKSYNNDVFSIYHLLFDYSTIVCS